MFDRTSSKWRAPTHHGVLQIELSVSIMGEMIEGFGDEVVLFVAFLALSLVFLSLITCSRRRRIPDRAESTRDSEDHAHAQQPAAEGRPEASSDPVGQPQPRAGADGLRHRTHVASTAEEVHQQGGSGQLGGGQLDDGSEQQPRGDVRQPSLQPGGDQQSSVSSGGQGTTEEGQINIRLIQAGGPGHAREVCVAPTATLQHLRR